MYLSIIDIEDGGSSNGCCASRLTLCVTGLDGFPSNTVLAGLVYAVHTVCTVCMHNKHLISIHQEKTGYMCKLIYLTKRAVKIQTIEAKV
jgi:hypothetical protein